MLSQTVRLKNTATKRTLPFQRSIYMQRVKHCNLLTISFLLQTGTCNLHCCRWYKFTIKALLCSTADSIRWLFNTHRMYCCVHCKTIMRTCHNVTSHDIAYLVPHKKSRHRTCSVRHTAPTAQNPGRSSRQPKSHLPSNTHELWCSHAIPNPHRFITRQSA